MASMEFMETIDFYCMEKFVTDVREDRYSGATSRSSLSSSPSSSDSQSNCLPNRRTDTYRVGVSRTIVVGRTYLICLTVGLGG